MYLLCCGVSFAVIHVDILHGDQGDAVFLSIGCGAARGRKGTWVVTWGSRSAMGWSGNCGVTCWNFDFCFDKPVFW